ncbi:MAG: glycosyltransferase family 4 protein [Actinobacteria bacterium]|nr:glycosyltransferase family 4 protein [Actinomycetota bacterium]
MKNKVKKVLLITHAIAPYRIPLFNYIHQMGDFDFKVITLAEKEKNRSWRISQNEIKFNQQVLTGLHFYIYGEKREIPIHLNRKVMVTIWQYNPDVIITAGYDSLAYWQAFLYCKIFKKKYILWNESSLLSIGSVRGIRGLLKRFIIKGSSNYVAFGTKAKEYLEFLGANPKNVFTSVNTVDLEYFRGKILKFKKDRNLLAERREYPKILFLYVGQLIKRKGVIQILSAFDILKDDEIGLLIIGDGPEEKNLMKFCKENTIKNVFFEGYCQQSELPKYYALADVFILSSFLEVWGLVVNEALASGLYVLCSKYAGVAYDLIKEGWNGEIFDSNNIDEFVKSIKQTKKKIDSIRNRREIISQHACREFGIEDSAQAFLEAIKNV